MNYSLEIIKQCGQEGVVEWMKVSTASMGLILTCLPKHFLILLEHFPCVPNGQCYNKNLKSIATWPLLFLLQHSFYFTSCCVKFITHPSFPSVKLVLRLGIASSNAYKSQTYRRCLLFPSNISFYLIYQGNANKTTFEFYLTLVRMAVFKRTKTVENDIEKKGPYTLLVGV
jgi:hypothetical protein